MSCGHFQFLFHQFQLITFLITVKTDFSMMTDHIVHSPHVCLATICYNKNVDGLRLQVNILHKQKKKKMKGKQYVP